MPAGRAVAQNSGGEDLFALCALAWKAELCGVRLSSSGKGGIRIEGRPWAWLVHGCCADGDGLTSRVETGLERGVFRSRGGFSASFQPGKYLEVSRDDGGPYSVVLLCVRLTPFCIAGG